MQLDEISIIIRTCFEKINRYKILFPRETFQKGKKLCDLCQVNNIGEYRENGHRISKGV